jgi:hypothetical protein
VAVFAIAAAYLAFTPASIASANGNGTLNVVHGIPGAVVDVCASGDATGNEFARVIEGFEYTDIETLDLPEGDYDATVVAAGADCNPDEAILSASGLFLPAGANVSVVAHLDANGVPALTVGVNDTSEGNRRRTSRLTAYHVAEAPAVDIRAGKLIPYWNLFQGVENGQSADLDLWPGRYKLAIVPEDGRIRDAVATDRVRLQKGTNTVLYAVGSLNDGSFTVIAQIIELEED